MAFADTPNCCKFVGGLSKLVAVAGDEHEVVIVSGEQACQFIPDAAGRAADQGR